VSILAASPPSKITNPVTTSINGSSVKFNWDLASAENGAVVIAYRITFKKSNGTFEENTTNCNGALTAIFTARECSVPMATFTSSYGLTLNNPIVALVYPINSVGEGPPTDENTPGILAQTKPLKPPSAPTQGTSTSHIQIHAKWLSLVGDDNGGSAITTYELVWDNGENILPEYTISDTLVLEYIKAAT
jgi:hypothetical protein